uniref:Uncharacterized protein n=1 Tax=Arundo donax TaxID=35708 RepID=A0A0A9DH44_ARUDO
MLVGCRNLISGWMLFVFVVTLCEICDYCRHSLWLHSASLFDILKRFSPHEIQLNFTYDKLIVWFFYQLPCCSHYFSRSVEPYASHCGYICTDG